MNAAFITTDSIYLTTSSTSTAHLSEGGGFNDYDHNFAYGVLSGFDSALGTLIGATYNIEATTYSQFELSVYNGSLSHNEVFTSDGMMRNHASVLSDGLGILSEDIYYKQANWGCSTNASGSCDAFYEEYQAGYPAPEFHTLVFDTAVLGELLDNSIEIAIGTNTYAGFSYSTPQPSTDAYVYAGSGLPALASITYEYEVSSVPVPATAWLFGSGILGLVSVARRTQRVLPRNV